MPIPNRPVVKKRKAAAKQAPAVAGVDPIVTKAPPKKTGRKTMYQPEFCDEIIDLGRLGWSKVQCASHFNVLRQTLYEWRKQYPDFAEAMAIADEHAQAYWENVGHTGATTKTVDGTIWGKIMSARFKDDWREVKGVEHSGQIDTGRTNLMSDIMGLLAQRKVKDLV